MGHHAPADNSNSAHTRERVGIELVHASYDEVARAFADYNNHDRHERGGRRVDRPTRVNDWAPGLGHDYHVESSYTPEQRKFVGITIAALNKMARGEVIVGSERQIPDFGDRVKQNFLSRPMDQASFGESVEHASLDLFSDFGRVYPNLVPALKPIFSNAGLEGMSIVYARTWQMLREAQNGELEKLEARGLGYLAAKGKFTGPHGRNSNPAVDYEVWCSGEAFAKTLIRQSYGAAKELIDEPGVREGYDFWKDSATSRSNNPVFALEEKIDDIAMTTHFLPH